jgi:hypothetical protein
MTLQIIRVNVIVIALRFAFLALFHITGAIGIAGAATQGVYHANPRNYRAILDSLVPGDMLILDAGTYEEGLPVKNMHGEEGVPIIISGPEEGPAAIFTGRNCCNTVQIDNASNIEIRNLDLAGQGMDGDAVYAAGISHHITLENLTIRGHDADKSIVGISTKAPAWNWVIRNNKIIGAGTGIYLGNSDGHQPFVNGLIEHNLIVNTIGYNLQIKHQIDRPNIEGMPISGKTIIRHNVLSKANNASSSESARPNLLVGHWPLSGAGKDDVYEIYGNFFYQNPYEALFQGEGNVALYDNLFINDYDDAVVLQPHNGELRMIRVFHNTIVASGRGILVSGGEETYEQKVIGNAVFASIPIQASDQEANITDLYGSARNYLINPSAAIGQLDMYPKVGALSGTLIDTSIFASFVDWNKDFNGDSRNGVFRGAYAGEGQNPGWQLKLDNKPLPNSNGGDMMPPDAPSNLIVQ